MLGPKSKADANIMGVHIYYYVIELTWFHLMGLAQKSAVASMRLKWSTSYLVYLYMFYLKVIVGLRVNNNNNKTICTCRSWTFLCKLTFNLDRLAAQLEN